MRSISLILILVASASAQQPTREAVIAEMKPYEGQTNPGVDPSTLTGKVMSGYQGWLASYGKRLAAGKRPLDNRTLRIMNEIPGVAAAVIVVLVIVKPF